MERALYWESHLTYRIDNTNKASASLCRWPAGQENLRWLGREVCIYGFILPPSVARKEHKLSNLPLCKPCTTYLKHYILWASGMPESWRVLKVELRSNGPSPVCATYYEQVSLVGTLGNASRLEFDFDPSHYFYYLNPHTPFDARQVA